MVGQMPLLNTSSKASGQSNRELSPRYQRRWSRYQMGSLTVFRYSPLMKTKNGGKEGGGAVFQAVACN